MQIKKTPYILFNLDSLAFILWGIGYLQNYISDDTTV